MEAMPSNCDPHSVTGVYKIGHNPVLFYPNDASACLTNDVAVPSLTATSGTFYTDLQNQTLPAFRLAILRATFRAGRLGINMAGPRQRQR
jgi:hypothetical protein